MSDRLDSWKGIAGYLGRDVRTVQRWAAGRQLPVHHLPGGDRPRVFSLKSEIDAWMRAGGASANEATVSVAVLPFLNLSDDAEGQYFGDGLADDVINALVRIPGVRVTARTSSFAFSGRGHDVRRIGARLGAAWLLEGSVRRERSRVRISAQLVNARDGFHAWSECYDRELTDVFAIQDEIAAAITRAMSLKLALEPAPVAPPTTDLAAYDLWVKGRSMSQQFTREAFARARECFEEAIARDPRFARPYFGLADLLFYGVQFGLDPAPPNLARAREAIAKALELDETFGEAHALQGIARGLLDYDWPGAEASFRRAFELSPGSASVLWQHAWYHLVPRLRLGEALEQARRSVELDPLSPRAHGIYGLVLVAARQYPQAVEECRTALELAPGVWWLKWFYGTALLLDGRQAEGLQQFQSACDEIRQPLLLGAMAMLYDLSGRAAEAARLREELEATSRTAYVPPAAFAFASMGLGGDHVFDWLHKAIDARDPIVTHLPSMPLYDGIRHHPRFEALLARMHLGGEPPATNPPGRESGGARRSSTTRVVRS